MDHDTITADELDGIRRRLRSLGHEVTDDDEALRGFIRLVQDRTPVPQPSRGRRRPMSEAKDRGWSGKVVREDRFLVRHRVLQFAAVFETDEDAQTVRRALEVAYDPVLLAPADGATRCEKVHGDGPEPAGLVERVERIIDILADSRNRGHGARIEDATEALQELRRRLIAGEG